MAGSYPDAPSRRMAWDDDGTIAMWGTLSSYVGLTAFTSPQMQDLNDEDDVLVLSTSGERYIVYLFPELREFDGFFWRQHFFSVTPQKSTNTTNGVDGTWTNLTSLTNTGADVRPDYRNVIQSYAESGIRGFRHAASTSGGFHGMKASHIYGEIAPGQTPDRLLFVDTGTNLEFNLPIDYGDTPRGSATDRTFKLRNNSGSLTASTIQITAESLYLSSGNWFTFSEGGAFQATLALASSIGSGADSPTITARRDIPDSETLSLHAARFQVSVGSW